jgi:hypothetical protein
MSKSKSVKPAKAVNLSAHDKVLAVLMSGEAVPKKVLEDMFGAMSYKLSAYILYCKNERTKAVIRANREGRKVISYQLMNPQDVQQYWTNRGINLDTIKSLADLNAQAVVAETTDAKETETV